MQVFLGRRLPPRLCSDGPGPLRWRSDRYLFSSVEFLLIKCAERDSETKKMGQSHGEEEINE